MSAHFACSSVFPRLLRVLGGVSIACTCLFLSSCATEEVVVATLPSDDSDCASNADCLTTAFCARESCGDARGLCKLRPVLCDDQGPPTCGCDGVSYWNDCLREQYGASASVPESCTRDAAACSDEHGADCPVLGASCAKLLPPGAACEESTPGACWILPAECPEFGPPGRWMACDDPIHCLDACSALRTGRPYRNDFMRQCPPPDFPGR